VIKLPPNLIFSKNLLGQTAPWILLLKVVFPQDGTMLHICNNTENVFFPPSPSLDRQEYFAVPFDLDFVVSQDSKGTIPQLQLRISNETRAMQGYLEQYSGGIEASTLIIPVNTDHLGEDYTGLKLNGEVSACYSDDSWVYWTIGPPNPLTKRFPYDSYTALNCNWTRVYRGVECKFSGADPGGQYKDPCPGSYDACLARNNLINFGGHPGLQSGKLRVV
jgi:phage-related protein